MVNIVWANNVFNRNTPSNQAFGDTTDVLSFYCSPDNIVTDVQIEFTVGNNDINKIFYFEFEYEDNGIPPKWRFPPDTITSPSSYGIPSTAVLISKSIKNGEFKWGSHYTIQASDVNAPTIVTWHFSNENPMTFKVLHLWIAKIGVEGNPGWDNYASSYSSDLDENGNPVYLRWSEGVGIPFYESFKIYTDATYDDSKFRLLTGPPIPTPGAPVSAYFEKISLTEYVLKFQNTGNSDDVDSFNLQQAIPSHHIFIDSTGESLIQDKHFNGWPFDEDYYPRDDVGLIVYTVDPNDGWDSWEAFLLADFSGQFFIVNGEADQRHGGDPNAINIVIDQGAGERIMIFHNILYSPITEVENLNPPVGEEMGPKVHHIHSQHLQVLSF